MKIIICTNNQQQFGSYISKYSFSLITKYNLDDIEIVNIEDKYQNLCQYHNRTYFRNGIEKKFDINDLQSFTISRFFIPEYCNYEGMALVIDPDIFCVRDFSNYLDSIIENYKDFQIAAKKGKNLNEWESSVMLMNCSNLRFLSSKNIIKKLFDDKTIDYNDLMRLKIFDLNIVELKNEMNSFDSLNSKTLLLHNTNRITQPWKEGLKINFIYHNQNFKSKIKFILKKILSMDKFKKHPDENQINLFFYFVNKALDNNFIDISLIKEEIAKKNIRKDLTDYLNDHHFEKFNYKKYIKGIIWKFNNQKFKKFKSNNSKKIADLDSLKSEGCSKISGAKIFNTKELDLLIWLKDFAKNETNKNINKKLLIDRNVYKSYRTNVGGYLTFDKKKVEIDFNNIFLKNILNIALKKEFLNLADSYLGVPSYLGRFYLWHDFFVKDNPNQQGTQFWHRDQDDFCFIKFFIYLNDINSESGPFTYLAKSGKYGVNNNLNLLGKPVEFQSFLGVTDENSFLKGNHNVKELTGSFSDIVIADTSGYHKGKLLERNNERFMLVFEYISRLSSKKADYTIQNSHLSDLDKSQLNYLS